MTDTAAPANWKILIPLLIGSAVAIALGVYGNNHTPAGTPLPSLFFSGPLNFKVWMGTVVIVLALVQLLTASRMYGWIKFPREKPAWFNPVHRWSGRLALLATLPVAWHCLYSLGYQTYSTRVMVHSLVGCFVYGAIVAKLTVLKRKDLPRWGIPVFGGISFLAFTVVWYTSSLWFYREIAFPGI